MLDQDARPEVGGLPEPTVPSPTTRGRRSALTAVLAVIAAVALAAVGFAVGRASGNGSSDAVTTRPTPAQQPSSNQPVTKGTVPTLAFGEAVESQPDRPLDNATRDALAADMLAARVAAAKYPTVADARRAQLM